jgi:hypothetical protein
MTMLKRETEDKHREQLGHERRKWVHTDMREVLTEEQRRRLCHKITHNRKCQWINAVTQNEVKIVILGEQE